MTFLVVVLLGAMVLFALHRRRYVKFGVRFLGATLFLEAADQPVPPQASATHPPVQFDTEHTAPLPLPDQKLVEATRAK
jgi:hypothetical protein